MLFRSCRCEQVSLEAAAGHDLPDGFDAAVLVDRPDTSPAADTSLRSLQHRRLERLGKARVGVLILTDRPWVFADFSVGVVCTLNLEVGLKVKDICESENSRAHVVCPLQRFGTTRRSD